MSGFMLGKHVETEGFPIANWDLSQGLPGTRSVDYRGDRISIRQSTTPVFG